MAYQLVVTGNRILAYGTDCFYSMGGTVICPNTGKAYQNATVVSCDCIPCDIDTVNYEYHAGSFVPCAPSGNELKLLWENASPASNFEGQTITLADDKFTFLLIETAEQVFVVSKSATLSYASVEDWAKIIVTTRTVAVSGKNITISSASSYGFDENGNTNGDYSYSYIKPLRIYGM